MNPVALINAMPGAISQGLIWGIMAIGVYITYRVLDFSDLTVDGSICTGACVCAVLLGVGVPPWVSIIAALLAGALTGMVTGLLHTRLGIPSILAGILTQLMLYSVNLVILGGKSPADITIATLTPAVTYNEALCAQLGIAVPAE